MTASDHLKHRTGSLGGDQDEKAVQELIAQLEQVSAQLEGYKSQVEILQYEKKRIIEIGEAALAQKTRECEELRAAKDGAYSERDKLVALLSKVFPAWLERHPDADTTWDNDWRWIVFLSIPDQVSWHIHDSELWMFDHLERRAGNSWDGHTTPEKYARCQLAKPANVEQLQRQVAEMSEPVTDEEWAKYHGWIVNMLEDDDDREPFQYACMNRQELDIFIASRARTK